MAVLDRPVMVSVSVQVMVMAPTPPTMAGTTMVPVAPGKGATPPEPVVVTVGTDTVPEGLLETTVAEMLIGCPVTELVKGSVMVTKLDTGGMVKGIEAPGAAPVVRLRLAGALTLSELPVTTSEAELVRVPVRAMTVMVWVPLKGGGENATPTDPLLLVLTVPSV